MINNILFKPLLLFLMVLCFVGCHHEEACFLGRVEQKEKSDLTILAQAGLLLIVAQ